MADPPVDTPRPFAVLRTPDLARFLGGRMVSTIGVQMGSVAIGWQVYERSHSYLKLGFVGLAQFLPAVLLALVTGAVADRVDRRRIVVACQSLIALGWLTLALVSRSEMRSLAPVYAVLVLLGVARAFQGPANQALLPNLVAPSQVGSAVALGSTTWQVATIVGPAIGGVLYGAARHPSAVYAVSALCALSSALLNLGLRPRPAAPRVAEPALRTLLAGVEYVRTHRLVLALISLDLFAVLLGGAVALLPVFARDVLHTGEWGLGVLRGAPSVGAAVTALALAWWPMGRRAGPIMLGAVTLFGLATVAFGLSRSFALSLVALAVVGATDMVSVVIRQHAVQVSVPDAMRGRVSAVNLVFVGASNELGEFESGITAELLGPVGAVVLGGLGTVLVVGAWALLFPELRRLDRLDSLKPA